MYTIIDRAVFPSGALNQSEYVVNLDKLAEMPPGCEEIDMGGSRWRGDEEDHASIRYWKCPWSARLAFQAWALGYSYSEISPGAAAQNVNDDRAFWNFLGTALAASTVPQPVTTLYRVIPAQDAEQPHLFCSSIELMRGEGALLFDPENFAQNAAGATVITPDYPPNSFVPGIYIDKDRQVVPLAAFYGDNSEGGAVGVSALVPDNDLIEPVPAQPPSRKFREGICIFRLTYTPRRYAVLTNGELALKGPNGVKELGRYVERDRDYAVESIPLNRFSSPGSANPLRFINDPSVPAPYRNAVIEQAGVKLLATAALTYDWHHVPDPPEAAFGRCVGKVNASTFDGVGGGLTYPAGSLLCQPWKTVRRVNPLGRVTFKVRYRFLLRPQGWNSTLAANGNFYPMTFGGDPNGPKVYESADFNELFQVRSPVAYNG